MSAFLLLVLYAFCGSVVAVSLTLGVAMLLWPRYFGIKWRKP